MRISLLCCPATKRLAENRCESWEADYLLSMIRTRFLPSDVVTLTSTVLELRTTFPHEAADISVCAYVVDNDGFPFAGNSLRCDLHEFRRIGIKTHPGQDWRSAQQHTGRQEEKYLVHSRRVPEKSPPWQLSHWPLMQRMSLLPFYHKMRMYA